MKKYLLNKDNRNNLIKKLSDVSLLKENKVDFLSLLEFSKEGFENNDILAKNIITSVTKNILDNARKYISQFENSEYKASKKTLLKKIPEKNSHVKKNYEKKMKQVANNLSLILRYTKENPTMSSLASLATKDIVKLSRKLKNSSGSRPLDEGFKIIKSIGKDFSEVSDMNEMLRMSSKSEIDTASVPKGKYKKVISQLRKPKKDKENYMSSEDVIFDDNKDDIRKSNNSNISSLDIFKKVKKDRRKNKIKKNLKGITDYAKDLFKGKTTNYIKNYLSNMVSEIVK
jgi:hypothetical protein